MKIAIAKSRYSKSWKNKTVSWEEFISRLKICTRTAETVGEYLNMSKAEKDAAKDVGGFVAGELRDGQRKAENIVSRSMITLDADFANENFLEHVRYVLPYEFVVYSTHSYTKDKPRYRLIFPLLRAVTPDEYPAIARKLASIIGMDMFDSTTFEPHRLMYWGSCSINGEYIFEQNEAEWINPDDILSTYSDWRDITSYPRAEREVKKHKDELKKQSNPREKGGIIGAFCQTYDIHEAISVYLSDVYTPCDTYNDRYTYISGSTTAGMVVYDDLYSFSHHSTDATSGRLCNAWDLVRVHKFGHLDIDSTEEGTQLPSFKAMTALAESDKEVKTLALKQQVDSLRQDFFATEEPQQDDNTWLALLEMNKQGKITSCINNTTLIVMHDPILKNIKYNQHKFAIEATKLLPWGHIGNWRDEDDSQLLVYMQRYGQQTRANMFTAIQKVADDRKFHPILEYLETLEWDGIDRLDTLFMDYLGAEDTHLNRIMTRKTFCAAVARVYHPGIKFDTMLVLKGEQGIGKGRLLRRMAVNDDWFNDSMRLNDTKDKTAAELIQGYWIIEIGELAGLSRIDERVLKSFLSRQDDVYRQSYGRRSQSHLRQCIFIGTTNEHEFLTDITGNRRYWIIPCMTNKPSFSIDGMLDYEVNQIWAEALYRYRHKETLYLGGDDIKALNLVHEAHFVDDPLVGLVKEFLESTEKTKVCTLEIWVELLMNDMKSLNYNESRRISNAMRKIEGWVKTTPRRFGQYGTQKGWEKK